MNDEYSAFLGGDMVKHCRNVGIDFFWLGGFVIEESGLSGRFHDERLLVVSALNAKTLRQTPTPGSLFAHGSVAWTRNHLGE